MDKKQDPIRNRPADIGTDNDPNVRDEDARQPGVNTISSSDTDEANQDLTETAASNFSEEPKDPRADLKFDEVDLTGRDDREDDIE
jgi:hypothetical protein